MAGPRQARKPVPFSSSRTRPIGVAMGDSEGKGPIFSSRAEDPSLVDAIDAFVVAVASARKKNYA